MPEQTAFIFFFFFFLPEYSDRHAWANSIYFLFYFFYLNIRTGMPEQTALIFYFIYLFCFLFFFCFFTWIFGQTCLSKQHLFFILFYFFFTWIFGQTCLSKQHLFFLFLFIYFFFFFFFLPEYSDRHDWANSINMDQEVVKSLFALFEISPLLLGISKQCRPRSDAAKRRVWSGSTLFATHPAEFRYISRYSCGLTHVKRLPLLHYSGVDIFWFVVIVKPTPGFLKIYMRIVGEALFAETS